MQLREIAYARSGDKGFSANIGVIAKSHEDYLWIREHLTAERVEAHFKLLSPKKTLRYELPNLDALNFVLIGVLGEGGSRSLRIDAQGKALGQALLEMEL